MPITIKHAAPAGIIGALAVTAGKGGVRERARQENVARTQEALRRSQQGRQFRQELALKRMALALQEQQMRQTAAIQFAQLDARMAQSSMQQQGLFDRQALGQTQRIETMHVGAEIQAEQQERQSVINMATIDFNQELEERWYSEKDRIKDQRLQGFEQEVMQMGDLSPDEKEDAISQLRMMRLGLRMNPLFSPKGPHKIGDDWIDPQSGARMFQSREGPEVLIPRKDLPDENLLSFDGRPMLEVTYYKQVDKAMDAFRASKEERVPTGGEFGGETPRYDTPEKLKEQWDLAFLGAMLRPPPYPGKDDVGLARRGLRTELVSQPQTAQEIRDQAFVEYQQAKEQAFAGQPKKKGKILDPQKPLGDGLERTGPRSIGPPMGPPLGEQGPEVFDKNIGSPQQAKALMKMLMSQYNTLPKDSPVRANVAEHIRLFMQWIESNHNDWVPKI